MQFDETQHPRDNDGKFTDKGGGEAKRVFELADELGVPYDRNTSYQALKARVEESQNSSRLIPYTDKEKQNLSSSNKIIIPESEEDIGRFIQQARNNESSVQGKKLLLGKIDDSTSQRIKKAVNVDLSNYNVELRASDILHAFNRHGENSYESLHGQYALDDSDIKKFSNIITSFDDVELGNKDRSLVFSKRIGNKIVAVTYYAEGNHSLSLKTMYINK